MIGGCFGLDVDKTGNDTSNVAKSNLKVLCQRKANINRKGKSILLTCIATPIALL
jgi:hypothetical protein